MSAFRLIPLGVGDAFSALYYSASMALEAEGQWLLIDCPHPIRKMLREAGREAGVPLDVDRFAAVVLTHLHADHSSGLEDLAYFSVIHLGRKVRLLTHPLVSARLWEGCLAGGMEWAGAGPGEPPARRFLDDYFDVTGLSDEQAVRYGPFTIECRRTIHTIPTTGLLVRAAGRCLGYSADTAYDPGLIDWLSQADLIVHETNRGIHTPYEKLAALPAALRVKTRLIHYPDDFDRDGSQIEPLRQGRSYPI